MGWLFRKRINLFGGLGINLGKRGASLSLQTPFGSISSKGATVRTGIPGLSYRFSASSKSEAISLFERELDKINDKGKTFWIHQENLKDCTIRNDGSLSYPSEEFDSFVKELVPTLELGKEIIQDLTELMEISRQYDLRMINKLKFLSSEMQKAVSELDDVLSSCNMAVEEENSKQHHVVTPPPIPQIEQLIKFCCWNCDQKIEVNTSAKGQSFNCPTCNSNITVP